MPTTPKYWYFIDKANRDEWLRKAVSRGLHVKAGPIRATERVPVPIQFIADYRGPVDHRSYMTGPLYTIVDVDGRVGK